MEVSRTAEHAGDRRPAARLPATQGGASALPEPGILDLLRPGTAPGNRAAGVRMAMGDRGGLPRREDPPRNGRSPGPNTDCGRAGSGLRRRLLRPAPSGGAPSRNENKRAATATVETQRCAQTMLNGATDQPCEG